MKRIWTASFAALGILVLILDAKTALEGANDGIRLCLLSVIPSLFPFLVLSILLTGALNGANNRLLRPIGRLCGIPEGAEGLMIVGLLGGYPVGAQAVSKLYKQKCLTLQEGRRLIGFCSNAGPAFIFGIIAAQFADPLTGWKLWLIHIFSALAVGMLLPGRTEACRISVSPSTPSLTESLSQSVSILARICGWVLLFRILIRFLERWFLWLLPSELQILLLGLLELTNGCCSLLLIQSESLRFILASVLLAFGGVCVLMQTQTQTGELGLGMYLPGKVMQACISGLLAVTVTNLGLFPAVFLAISGIICRELKNRGRNSLLLGV